MYNLPPRRSFSSKTFRIGILIDLMIAVLSAAGQVGRFSTMPIIRIAHRYWSADQLTINLDCEALGPTYR